MSGFKQTEAPASGTGRDGTRLAMGSGSGQHEVGSTDRASLQTTLIPPSEVTVMFTLSATRGSTVSRALALGCSFAGPALAALLTASPASAHASCEDPDGAFGEHAPADAGVVLKAVTLRPGVTGDIHLRVLRNPDHGCERKAIVAVHGAGATASTLVPLARSIFADADDHQVCRFIAVDLPGHGGSSLPQGALFGDLTLQDYAAAVIGTLDRLEDRGVHTTALMGHSMGGLVVQLAQQSLTSHGSSLRDAFGVKHVVLFAAAGPRAIPCAYCQNQQAAAALGPFIGFDPALGLRFAIPDALWTMLAFTTPMGTLATNAPTAADVTAHGYNSPESLSALSGLLGAPPFQRPDVAAGIFAPHLRTRLDVVSFENDSISAESTLIFRAK